MHASALENIARCRDRYMGDEFLASHPNMQILLFGLEDEFGSCRTLFSFSGARFTVAENHPLSRSNPTLLDTDLLPYPDDTFALVLVGPKMPGGDWHTDFKRLARVLHVDGLLLFVSPSIATSTDCFGNAPLTPGSLEEFAIPNHLSLLESWIDRRGPSRDIVGVFSKHPRKPVATGSGRTSALLATLPLPTLTPGDSEQRDRASTVAEETRPERPRYTVLLEQMHRILEPRLYFEIGVRHGRSLQLARGPAIGVDPAATIDGSLPATSTIVSTTSDEFFHSYAATCILEPIDLAFIDGMHLFEYGLRDFMNIERYCSSTASVVFDDIFPYYPIHATRLRRSGIWMGDVWKIVSILREYRPQLTLIPVDVATGGSLIVAGLDPTSEILWDTYNEIVARYSTEPFSEVPAEILARAGAAAADDPQITRLLTRLRALRDQSATRDRVREELRLLSAATP